MAKTRSTGRKSAREIFEEKKLISPNDLKSMEESLHATAKPFHQLAVEMGFLDKMDALAVLAKEWRQKAVDFDNIEPDPDCIKIVPEPIARKSLVMPFAKEGGVLLVAMADPLDFSIIEDIHVKTDSEVRVYLAMPNDIVRELDKAYGHQEQALTDDDLRDAAQQKTQEMMESLKDVEDVERVQEKTDVLEVDASAPEVEKIINAAIIAALQMRASDIHFEPFDDVNGRNSRVVVRLRVDGFLREAPFKVPWSYRNAVLAKLKIMTGTMNITERRSPQSGRIAVMAKGRPIELRVESFPTVYGESASLRILDRKNVNVDIKKIGLSAENEAKLLSQLKGVGGKKNYGMILVTGPTGSGKSTTLYASLNHINKPTIRILTAENPVEYNINGIIQVPVNPEVKLGGDKKFDFAGALRSFLRADPDVIMVGEIRDQETAKIALEAGMTGHLVFATLHTNDAASTMSRLVEMGIPHYMVVGTVKCIISQRLCRSICGDCKKPRPMTPDEIAVFQVHGVALPANNTLEEGIGCPACGNSGYKGRTGIHEIILMDEVVRNTAGKDLRSDVIREAAMNASPQKMRTLIQDGLVKTCEGLTTVKEVLGESS